ncbi:MAG: OadG family protein [Muribaculaceae bacterium]|nr:OadG family protein [Muribaculaceae bacterium]
MIKKSLISVSLCLALACQVSPSYAQEIEQPAPMTEVAELPEGQEAVEADVVPSEEVNYVEESAVAKKMTQAEKAENVKENDSWGGAITIISMCIVLAALIVLSILFLGFGKISAKLLSRKKMEAHGVSEADAEDHHQDVDSGETIAAIAAALAEHFSGEHDMEDTILTIRRMKKAYSPWNSKIYNLRELPTLQRNAARPLPVNKNVR